MFYWLYISDHMNGIDEGGDSAWICHSDEFVLEFLNLVGAISLEVEY